MITVKILVPLFVPLLLLSLVDTVYGETSASAVKLNLHGTDARRIAESNDYHVVAEFVARMPASRTDPSQGWSGENATLIFSRDFTAFVSDTTYSLPAQYAPREKLLRDYDYDEDGNLIVWRSSKVVAVCSPERNDRLEYSDRFTVSPAGDIVSSASTVQLSFIRSVR